MGRDRKDMKSNTSGREKIHEIATELTDKHEYKAIISQICTNKDSGKRKAAHSRLTSYAQGPVRRRKKRIVIDKNLVANRSCK